MRLRWFHETFFGLLAHQDNYVIFAIIKFAFTAGGRKGSSSISIGEVGTHSLANIAGRVYSKSQKLLVPATLRLVTPYVALPPQASYGSNQPRPLRLARHPTEATVCGRANRLGSNTCGDQTPPPKAVARRDTTLLLLTWNCDHRAGLPPSRSTGTPVHSVNLGVVGGREPSQKSGRY